VKPGESLILVTDQGKMIRTTVADIRIAGRNTQGVTIFNVSGNEKVVSVARIDESEEEEVELGSGDELAPESGATVGEDLAEGPPEGN
jgi:DNA gyrase subunit A